jgi:hypothetical protein
MPTLMIQAYMTADAIANSYRKYPGPLIWMIERRHGRASRHKRRGSSRP